ncbi:hypothetical protein AAVH_01971 [Aphelenchoides avenae]|nr:hypothetical protein AAVH_01971 [Aphelenchus avenae]
MIQQLLTGQQQSRSTGGKNAGGGETDLLKAVLNGKLGEINWMSALLGGENHETAEDGNALAQLFKGGLLGSAVNDDPTVARNSGDRISPNRF